MDFQSVNPLNVLLNMVSGNLLPMTADNSSFSIPWRAYSVLMWLLQIVLAIAVFLGCINERVSQEKVLKDGMICFVIVWEIFFIVAQLHIKKDRIGQLIRRINDILSVADDTMKNIVMTTSKPTETVLKLYCISGVILVIMWSLIPLVLLFQKDVFYYEDYKVPAALFVQPLSPRTFILGCLFITISNMYIFVKKIGMDTYIVHLMLLTTALYRYTAVKLAMILREEDKDKNDLKNRINTSLTMDSSKWKERQMKALCQNYNALI